MRNLGGALADCTEYNREKLFTYFDQADADYGRRVREETKKALDMKSSKNAKESAAITHAMEHTVALPVH